MARYIIQLPAPTDVRALASYIRETVAATGTEDDVDQSGGTIEFGQRTHDVLSALPPDSDGHIDADGNLWVDGADYPIGRL